MFKLLTSVQEEPSYFSVLTDTPDGDPETGSPATSNAAVVVPAEPTAFLPSFILVPDAHDPPVKSVIVSLKVLVVELKYHCPSTIFEHSDAGVVDHSSVIVV